MERRRKKINVTYSSTNEKDIKDVVSALIKTHENKYNENAVKKVANG